MRRLVIGGALGVFLLSVVLVACGGSGAGSTGDQARRFQDMWEIDQIEKDFHRATTEKDIDLMMSLYAPNATMTVGQGATASGLDEIRRFWLEESAPFAAREQLDLGSPRVQARDHGQRRPGHAALRVPLRRCRDRRGRVGHDRRLRCGPDRREVADHEHGRRDDRPGSLRSWPRSRSRGSPAEGRRRIGDPFVRAVARLPVNGSDEAADRVRRHVPAAGRGRPARAARARAVERSRRERRAAPGAGRRSTASSRPRRAPPESSCR